MGILDAGVTVLAVDEIVHHARLQRSRPKQRHQRHDVLETVRLQTADQILHAAGFQLEHRRGLVTFQQIEGKRVVQGDRADIER